jgi:hypothetical protein
MSFKDFLDTEAAKKILCRGAQVTLTEEEIGNTMGALHEALESLTELPPELLADVLEGETGLSITLEGITSDDLKTLHMLARKRLWRS